MRATNSAKSPSGLPSLNHPGIPKLAGTFMIALSASKVAFTSLDLGSN